MWGLTLLCAITGFQLALLVADILSKSPAVNCPVHELKHKNATFIFLSGVTQTTSCEHCRMCFHVMLVSMPFNGTKWLQNPHFSIFQSAAEISPASKYQKNTILYCQNVFSCRAFSRLSTKTTFFPPI